jgi:homoserine kinase type II
MTENLRELPAAYRAGSQDQQGDAINPDRAKARKIIATSVDEGNDLPSAQMIEEIISVYGLESLQVDSASQEGTGYITFRVTTPKNVLALRCKKGSASKIMSKHPEIKHSIEAQHRLILFLQDHGFPVAPPLLTKQGETYVSVRGIPCSLYPYINGRALDPRNLHQLITAAETLARYHQLTAGYSGIPPLSQPLFPEHFKEKLRDFREYSENFDDSLSMLGIAESMVAFESCLDEIETEMQNLPYDSLPKVVIHGDYKPENILFQGDDIAAVIDFGRSRNEARLFDIAKTIAGLVGTSDDAAFLDMTRAFFAGYISICPLNKGERSALFSLIQARVAIKNLERFIRLAKKTDMGEKFAKAERFNRLCQHLRSLRNNSEAITQLFQEKATSWTAR